MVFPSRYMPCPACGGSVKRGDAESHHCDPDRLLDYWMSGLRRELASFEPGFRAYLDTPDGRFESWVAAREVRAG